MTSFQTLIRHTLISFAFMVFCFNTALADWSGRFDVGGSPTFYDDDQLEDRTPITSRFRFQFEPDKADNWLFVANVKLQSEFNSEDGQKIRVRDLFARYGNKTDGSPFSLTAGLFQPRGISGTGDVLGAGVRYTIPISENTQVGLGALGGANMIIRDGFSDTDGLRIGVYLISQGTKWGQASVTYTSVTDTNLPGDERDYLAFSTTMRLGKHVDFYQSGEYTLSSEAGAENTFTYYYANAGYDVTDRFRFSITYDVYDRLPYLKSVTDDEDNPDSFDRYEVFKGQSIGPRLDIRVGKLWRFYGRYRYRETDDLQQQTWHQYLAGFGCAELARTGIGFNGSVFINRGDTKDYETAFISFNRDFGSALNVTLNVATDRFSYPETAASAPHVESTWRTGISGFYRINRKMTGILEYERTFGDDNNDHRILFNWQYRF